MFNTHPFKTPHIALLLCLGLTSACAHDGSSSTMLAATPSNLSSPPESGIVSDVELIPQETELWCWAASGEMIMEYLGRDVPQCDQANDEFGRMDCCGGARPSDCVNGGWPDFPKYGFRAISKSGAIDWDTLRNEIGVQHHPVAFSWKWNGGGGHMMVAIGYRFDAGNRYVSILDPWPVTSKNEDGGDRREISYAEFVGGPGWDHTHWKDFRVTK